MDCALLKSKLADQGYIAQDDLAMALHLALNLGRPLLVEGMAGVGKTALAGVLTQILDTRLIRLQCYEGLDAAQAIYEWNYQRQLLAIRVASGEGESRQQIEERIFSKEFLLERPLLAAITQKKPPVLLNDQVCIPASRHSDRQRHPRLERRASTALSIFLPDISRQKHRARNTDVFKPTG